LAKSALPSQAERPSFVACGRVSEGGPHANWTISLTPTSARNDPRGVGFQGHDVSRSNITYVVIGALVIAVAVLGYQLYQRQDQGVQINIGPGGASIEAK